MEKEGKLFIITIVGGSCTRNMHARGKFSFKIYVFDKHQNSESHFSHFKKRQEVNGYCDVKAVGEVVFSAIRGVDLNLCFEFQTANDLLRGPVTWTVTNFFP